MTDYKSFTPSALAALLLLASQCLLAADVTGTLIQTIITKEPPAGLWPSGITSPDPSDIAYLDSTGTLLICDGEVDEMPAFFTGDNLFEINLDGNLVATHSTTNLSRTGWSNEPVGCAYKPNPNPLLDGHLFISSDDQKTVFEINPGSDSILFTTDDTRTELSTSAFGNNDPEGVTYGGGALYIADGLNSEVYKVLPGLDGRFDLTEDNEVTHFDTESLGVHDPEGIAFEAPDRLFLVGKPATQMAHVYTAGPLLRTVDITQANAMKPAGLTLGPGSSAPTESHIYINDRGVDNNSDPNENDGKVYEFSVPALAPGNLPPGIAAGPDLTITLPSSANLDGASMADDGLPNPPNLVTTAWSQISGPGTVTFGNPNVVDATATFSTDGVYVLRLTASDGEFSNSDDVAIQVRQPFNAAFNTIYISSSSSDKIIADNLTFGDEDILAYNTVAHTWSMYFDGSNVGLSLDTSGTNGADVRDFDILDDGSILLGFDTPVTLPVTDDTTGAIVSTIIDDSDIVRFIPTSLGLNTTAGSYHLYFKGSAVGLDTDSERLDALALLPDGRLVISITSSSTTGAIQTGFPTVQDEDLIAFTATDLGANTAGTWQMYFDGSDVELSTTADEDVDGAWIDNNGDIYLTTLSAFSVTGAAGGGDDIFKCTPSSTGTVTACSYAFIWDGINSGLPTGVVVDGMDLSPPPVDATPPTVSITAPATGVTVSGTATLVSADASDNTGVLGVQFKLDGALLGEDTVSPYTVSWNTTTADNGEHNLTAVALDAAGNTTSSSTVSVTVNNDTTPPAVNITAPTGPTVNTGSVTVSADASDSTGVLGVQFKDGANNLGAEDTSPPYSIAWNATTVTGSHNLTAVARDAVGNTATSGAVSVTVNDTLYPTVSITAPTSGSTVTNTVTISASAADNIGVQGVQFWDGSTLLGEDTTSPYTLSWNTTATTTGMHSLTAVAHDAAGNITTSSTVSVTVITTLTLTPIADATIKAGSPGANYGTVNTIGTDNSPVEHFLIQFNVAGLAGKQILSAKLRLRNVNSSNKGGDFYAVASTWSETGVTWSNAPDASTMFASLGSVSTNTWYEVNVLPLTLITGDVFSVRIKSTSSNNAIYNSNQATGGYAPQLVITAQ